MKKCELKLLEKAASLIGEAHVIIEELRDEKQEVYDVMSERVQEGERGQALESFIAYLEDAMNGCDDAITTLESVEG